MAHKRIVLHGGAVTAVVERSPQEAELYGEPSLPTSSIKPINPCSGKEHTYYDDCFTLLEPYLCSA